MKLVSNQLNWDQDGMSRLRPELVWFKLCCSLTRKKKSAVGVGGGGVSAFAPECKGKVFFSAKASKGLWIIAVPSSMRATGQVALPKAIGFS